MTIDSKQTRWDSKRHPAELAEAIARAPQALLMLDYDGTLAPFRVERLEAIPYPGVRELLSELFTVEKARAVVVSGRGAREVAGLLGIDPHPEVWGSHGMERLMPDDSLERRPLDPPVQEGLDKGLEFVRERGLEKHLEHKPTGVALHWRGESDEVARQIEQAAREGMGPLAERDGLELMKFDGGMELRATAWHKGDAVQAILKTAPEGTFAAYLGDDRTDEDAFAALRDGDWSVLVRGEHRETAAGLWLVPPEELLAFLETWLHASRSA